MSFPTLQQDIAKPNLYRCDTSVSTYIGKKRNMPQIADSTSKRSIQRLLKFLTLQRYYEAAPGFSHALGLSSERLYPELFTYQGKTLVFRYTLSSRLPLTKLDSTVSLSTYLSLLDDVTTWALMCAKPQQPRPGVSTSFQCDWGPAAHLGMLPGSVVDIIATVTKVGKNLGFVRAEVRDVETGNLVCYGSHTKFLPLGRWLDFALSPVGQWMMGLYAKWMISPKSLQQHRMIPLCEMFDTLHFDTHTRAYFTASRDHLNPVGSLHGGFQAILMEMVGRQVAMTELATANVHLESIQISYMSAGSEKLQIDAEVVVLQAPLFVSMRVLVKRRLDGVVASEGLLAFTDSIQKAGKGKWRRMDGSLAGNVQGESFHSATQRTNSMSSMFSSDMFQSKL